LLQLLTPQFVVLFFLVWLPEREHDGGPEVAEDHPTHSFYYLVQGKPGQGRAVDCQQLIAHLDAALLGCERRVFIGAFERV
jgi:hypothetical protein